MSTQVFLIRWVQSGGVRVVCDSRETADAKLAKIKSEGDKEEYEIQPRSLLTINEV